MGPIAFNRKGRTNDRTVGRDPPGLPNRGTLGLREDGLNAVHASIEIIDLQLELFHCVFNLVEVPIPTGPRPLYHYSRSNTLSHSHNL